MILKTIILKSIEILLFPYLTYRQIQPLPMMQVKYVERLVLYGPEMIYPSILQWYPVLKDSCLPNFCD